MRIGVISDTHGHVEFTRPAIRMFEALEVSAVLHCGDIGSAEVIELFSAWPTHFVFGNCDYDTQTLREAMEREGQICHGAFGEIELAGVPIALIHSHDARRFDHTIASGSYRVVCYGHTHQSDNHAEGGVLVLNPGAIYRANPRSIAILELPTCEATIIPVD